MKIVNIIGGLGNQMFQYALAIALEEQFGEKVYVDTSLFDTYKVHNGLEIERIFGVSLCKAPLSELKRLTCYTKYYSLWRLYHKLLPFKKTICKEARDGAFALEVLQRNIDRYYDGYWQDSQYFEHCKDKIRTLYQFKPPLDERNDTLVAEIMHEKNATSVHIRRGDYLKSSLYAGICPIGYYKQSLAYIRQISEDNARFYIFSDDIAWCKENLAQDFGTSVVYVDWNKGIDSYKDMQLMSLCRYNIIANSSFSWWAAWLNNHPDKIIIAPRKWTNTGYGNYIQLPEWILI